jgi:hypothetical protein
MYSLLAHTNENFHSFYMVMNSPGVPRILLVHWPFELVTHLLAPISPTTHIGRRIGPRDGSPEIRIDLQTGRWRRSRTVE